MEYDFCAFYPKDPKLSEYFLKMSLLLVNRKNRIFQSNRMNYLLSLGIDEMHHKNKDFSSKVLNSVFWELSIYTYRLISGSYSRGLGKIKNNEILCYQITEFIFSIFEDIYSVI